MRKIIILFGFCILFLLGLSFVASADRIQIKGNTTNSTLGDAYVFDDNGANANANYGTLYYLSVNTFSPIQTQRTYITLNTSRIADISNSINTIDEVLFCLYSFADNINVVDSVNISIHEVYTYPWVNGSGGSSLNETTITANNQPCGTEFDNDSNCNLTSYDNVTFLDGVFGWNCFDVTGSLSKSDRNVSYALKMIEDVGTDESVFFYSKDSGGIAEYVYYLNVTYSPLTIIPSKTIFSIRKNSRMIIKSIGRFIMKK